MAESGLTGRTCDSRAGMYNQPLTWALIGPLRGANGFIYRKHLKQCLVHGESPVMLAVSSIPNRKVKDTFYFGDRLSSWGFWQNFWR